MESRCGYISERFLHQYLKVSKESQALVPYSRHPLYFCCSLEGNLTCMKYYCLQLREITRRELRWELPAPQTPISQRKELSDLRVEKAIWMSYQSILYQLLLAVCSFTCVLPVLSIPRGSDEPNPIEHKDNTITVIIKSSVWINSRPVISPLYLVLRLQYRSLIISTVLCIDVLLSRRIYKYFLIL